MRFPSPAELSARRSGLSERVEAMATALLALDTDPPPHMIACGAADSREVAKIRRLLEAAGWQVTHNPGGDESVMGGGAYWILEPGP